MNETQVKASKIEAQPTAKPSRNDSGAELGQGNPPSLRSLRVEAEIYAISKTLEYTGWNRRRAAQLLSISYRGILYKIRQHNLTPRPRGEESVGQILKADSQG
jgi:DNA-binding NtrC family response regulator